MGVQFTKVQAKNQTLHIPKGNGKRGCLNRSVFIFFFFGNLVPIFENEINVFFKSLCFLGSLL